MRKDDQQLVTRIQNGDQQAIGDLYRQYAGALYVVVFRILRSEEDANDVLQEAFVKIWKNIDRYDAGKAGLYTWMMNICRNLAIDKTRSKHFKRSGKIQNADEIVRQLGTTRTETDHIGLKEIVKQLEPEQEKLVDLIYFGGYTQKEVAEKLEMPLGTVKTRIRKAIQVLRKYF